MFVVVVKRRISFLYRLGRWGSHGLPLCHLLLSHDEVAHAFPRHYILKDGDLLKVDIVPEVRLPNQTSRVETQLNNVEQMKKYTQSYTGGLADSCWAYAVGTPSEKSEELDGRDQRSYVQRD